MKPLCAECGRSKFDREGRCRHCGMLDLDLNDVFTKFEREAKRRFGK